MWGKNRAIKKAYDDGYDDGLNRGYKLGFMMGQAEAMNKLWKLAHTLGVNTQRLLEIRRKLLDSQPKILAERQAEEILWKVEKEGRF